MKTLVTAPVENDFDINYKSLYSRDLSTTWFEVNTRSLQIQDF